MLTDSFLTWIHVHLQAKLDLLLPIKTKMSTFCHHFACFWPFPFSCMTWNWSPKIASHKEAVKSLNPIMTVVKGYVFVDCPVFMSIRTDWFLLSIHITGCFTSPPHGWVCFHRGIAWQQQLLTVSVNLPLIQVRVSSIFLWAYHKLLAQPPGLLLDDTWDGILFPIWVEKLINLLVLCLLSPVQERMGWLVPQQ